VWWRDEPDRGWSTQLWAWRCLPDVLLLADLLSCSSAYCDLTARPVCVRKATGPLSGWPMLPTDGATGPLGRAAPNCSTQHLLPIMMAIGPRGMHLHCVHTPSVSTLHISCKGGSSGHTQPCGPEPPMAPPTLQWNRGLWKSSPASQCYGASRATYAMLAILLCHASRTPLRWPRLVAGGGGLTYVSTINLLPPFAPALQLVYVGNHASCAVGR
jgi:hypothetical protein